VLLTYPVEWEGVRRLQPVIFCAGRSPIRLISNITREAERFGIPDVHAHRLRHTAAPLWHVAAGGDLLVTQRLLGHASVSTTQIYAAVADDALRAAVLAVPPITPPTAAGPR